MEALSNGRTESPSRMGLSAPPGEPRAASPFGKKRDAHAEIRGGLTDGRGEGASERGGKATVVNAPTDKGRQSFHYDT